jgi:seryl-tRNA synthetase
MLQIKYIRENEQKVRDGLKKRNWTEDNSSIVDKILLVDQKRRETQTKLDEIRAKSNQISAQIGQLYKEGEREKPSR